MTGTPHAAMRRLLLERREELRAALSQRLAAAETVELDQARLGRLSRMDALQGQAMEQAAATRAERGLRAIAAALQRLDTGDYGWCLECGAEIPPARLNFDPAAAHCVVCAQSRE